MSTLWNEHQGVLERTGRRQALETISPSREATTGTRESSWCVQAVDRLAHPRRNYRAGETSCRKAGELVKVKWGNLFALFLCLMFAATIRGAYRETWAMVPALGGLVYMAYLATVKTMDERA